MSRDQSNRVPPRTAREESRKTLISETLKTKSPVIKTLHGKSRPSPDPVQTKSRLNMPFLKTLRLFRTQSVGGD